MEFETTVRFAKVDGGDDEPAVIALGFGIVRQLDYRPEIVADLADRFGVQDVAHAARIAHSLDHRNPIGAGRLRQAEAVLEALARICAEDRTADFGDPQHTSVLREARAQQAEHVADALTVVRRALGGIRARDGAAAAA